MDGDTWPRTRKIHGRLSVNIRLTIMTEGVKKTKR